ncbi:chemotaxis protein CheA [Noviherbaspirillum suwonense]|uniref:histidine kinase n=1 Tax=Noviherbaspirillum suwonense TaxID=1224511 RepID=A0ABY1PYE7_9BURK|nr:chemotaxis protein CheA [Noviherbaspirillum suwonense]SMP49147.1 two-component system, chemotaxis family, sensor kinase CheA [Noviherbaspirillum suwonense]
MDDMLKDFVVEALELAVDVEERLLQLERHPDDPDALNAVFRSFHTIKGGAGFMNLPGMVSACHLTENLFDALRTGKTAVTPLAIEAALQASGFVADLLNQLHNGASPESLAPMPPELDRILTDAIEGRQTLAAPIAPAAPAAVAAADAGAAPQAGVDDAEVDWIAFYNAVVPAGMQAAPAPAAATAEPAPPAASQTGPQAISPVSAQPAQAWDGAERRGSSTEARAPEESIRVDAVKLDALLEVAGESVQAANQAAVLLEKLQQFKFDGGAATLMATLSETLGRASRYATELQRATLATRMQPVGRLFQKFPRLVRELARDLGKEVELVIEGAETEVDRVVVDSLYDPLVHMLRNSLDHGIENSDERLAAGKPARARILLKAWQEANSVMIVISDDGRGMDPQRLRSKAVTNGLIAESANLTPTEAYQLVFLPGFSTKEVASSVSGRGVGMDVVKTAVEKHRGAISIDSTLGTGTRFSIRLPIELSIVPTMLVTAAGAALGMPLALVERVVELPETFMHVGGAPVLRDQGLTLPVRSLAASLGYEPGEERVGIVVAAPSPYVLAVSAVDGTADLVIKPLTALSVPGITGTARSAEGELVLVVGLSFLLAGAGLDAYA